MVWQHKSYNRLKSTSITGVAYLACPNTTDHVKCAAITGVGDLFKPLPDGTMQRIASGVTFTATA